MTEPYKVRFIWPGDPVGRIVSGIWKQSPHRIIALTEASRSWRSFQDRKLEDIKQRAGRMFASRFEVHEADYDPDAHGDVEHYGSLIAAWMRKIRHFVKDQLGPNQSEGFDGLEIVLDVTGAPESVVLVTPLVASAVGSVVPTKYRNKFSVCVEYVQRGAENAPQDHAPNQTYLDATAGGGAQLKKISLADWRAKESNDGGADVRRIYYPRLNLALLDESPRGASQRRIFLAMNGHQEEKGPPKKSTRLAEGDGVGPVISASKIIKALAAAGLAEADRFGRQTAGRRSYAGDLLKRTVKELDEELRGAPVVLDPLAAGSDEGPRDRHAASGETPA